MAGVPLGWLRDEYRTCLWPELACHKIMKLVGRGQHQPTLNATGESGMSSESWVGLVSFLYKQTEKIIL